jgi:fumarate hydratase class II
LPEIGLAMLESLKLMITMNKTLNSKMLVGLFINTDLATQKLFRSPAVSTALSPLLGYNKAAELAKRMKAEKEDIFTANAALNAIDPGKLRQLMEPGNLLKKGFTVNDIKELEGNHP